ncbi:hypothetical protein [Kordia sp.]|uniref:hypothetical protein n=1 Tax=Kordia sp. TaxID=1965332 RepID=UPI003D2C8B31
MKKVIILVVFLCLFTSCQTGLYLVNQEYMNQRVTQTKSFPVEEFEIYVFDLCEDYEVSSKEELKTRFCDCPSDFYDEAKKRDIRKVEEIYILKHKASNLILYFTTFSHKYILRKEKFLNDQKIYENKIILDQIENIYIGKIDTEKNEIYFKGIDKLRDVTFYFDPAQFPEKILVTKGKMTTAENGYSIKETIPLDDVFRKNVKYIKNSKYTIDYYKGNNYEELPKHVSTINIIADEDELEVVFSFNDFEEHYKLASKRIRFYPSFESIVASEK